MVKLIALLKAKPGMTQEEFKKYYLEKHALIDLKFKNLTDYVFNLAKPDENGLPFNGVAELYWNSVEDMNEDFLSEVGKEGGADAANFTTEIVSILTEEYVIKPVR